MKLQEICRKKACQPIRKLNKDTVSRHLYRDHLSMIHVLIDALQDRWRVRLSSPRRT